MASYERTCYTIFKYTFIKDTLQQCERLRAKLQYINESDGPISIIEQNFQSRKRKLNKRIKIQLEDLMNTKRATSISNFVFTVDLDTACLTKKQLDKGYALFNNINDITFALNLRNGSLLIVNNYEDDVIDSNLRAL